MSSRFCLVPTLDRGVVSVHTQPKAALLPHLHLLAQTRPKHQLGTEEAAEEYTSIQLNKVSELMVHQDRFNQGCNWVISVGKHKGGRIWVEDSQGTRVSLVFFTPQRLGALSDEHWDTLLKFSSPCERLRAMQTLAGSYSVFADIPLQRLVMSAASKTEEWMKHHKKGHLNKIPDCPGCQLESGPRIIHSKTPKSDRKPGVLHGDLAKMDTDNRQFTWILVLAASVRVKNETASSPEKSGQ
eukprot:2822672-Amphidinium_carterae.1